MTDDLWALIEHARNVSMTPEQEAEQRRSFAYGNTRIENPKITRRLIAEADRRLQESGDLPKG